MQFFALVALVVLPRAEPAASPSLPSQIIVPTPTEAVGIDQLYAVRDGKLFTRRGAAPWALYDGTGTVPGSTRPIVAVFADERDHFTVITDDKLLHHHENGAWDTLWGLPQAGSFRDPLPLPFALDALRAGRISYSMRRDAVRFFEDRVGSAFHWGIVGTTSLYLLSDDGARILLADPWLPPDTSREVCGPRRGGVRLASVAASASSLLALSVDGAVFTGFSDYDADGGTPFYRYDYRVRAPHALFGDDPASELQTRALPGHDWREQPRLPLGAGARVSRLVGMQQTGAGNNARLLRVVGDDEHGTRGVWEKDLGASAWTFRAVDVAVPDDAWLDPTADAAIAPPAIAMQGFLRHGGPSLGWVAARTDDFWFHCTPFTLTLTFDGEDVPLVVHTVDAWTVLAQENAAESQAYKAMKATIVIDDAVRASLSPRTRARVAALFGESAGEDGPLPGDLGAPFAFALVANREELVLAPVSYPFNAERSRFELVLRRDPARRARSVAPIAPASTIATMHVPLRAPDFLLRCQREPALRARAATAMTAVRAARAEITRRGALLSLLETAFPLPLVPVDVLSVVTTARWTLPVSAWLIGLEQHVPAVLAAHRMAAQRTEEASRDDFDVVERALSLCVR